MYSDRQIDKQTGRKGVKQGHRCRRSRRRGGETEREGVLEVNGEGERMDDRVSITDGEMQAKLDRETETEAETETEMMEDKKGQQDILREGEEGRETQRTTKIEGDCR